MRKTIQSMLLLIFAAVSMAQVDPARTVATVNGEEIKGDEYYRRMEFLPNVGKRLGDRFAEFPPGFMTIEQLITEKLIFQLAKSLNCMATDAEIQAEFNQLKADNPKYIDQWNNSGRPLQDLLTKIKYDICQFKIVTKGITVTDQQVEKFYKDNKEIYTIPLRNKLRVIVVDSEDKKAAVDNELKAGAKFGDLATKYSLDVTKVAQGEYGTVAVSDLTEVVRTALVSVQVGKTTEWISAGEQWIKFLKEDVLPETVQPLDDRVRKDTRKRMMLDLGNKKNDITKLMLDARKAAKIVITNKDFADAYKKFIDNYIQQQQAKVGSQ